VIRNGYLTIILMLFVGIASTPVSAEELGEYTVKQLLEPCTEGDNDSRWGAVAESECEQYISGFTDALVLTGRTGKEAGICLPAGGNRADEVRWAFMKWAHRNFDLRGEPAAHGLFATLKAEFPCK
jgi:hypothetical protein